MPLKITTPGRSKSRWRTAERIAEFGIAITLTLGAGYAAFGDTIDKFGKGISQAVASVLPNSPETERAIMQKLLDRSDLYISCVNSAAKKEPAVAAYRLQGDALNVGGVVRVVYARSFPNDRHEYTALFYRTGADVVTLKTNGTALGQPGVPRETPVNHRLSRCQNG
jgi:hypothetical protein